MKSISGFTFVHNTLDSGYPIVEAIRAVRSYVDEIVVVDMQSTDDTLQVLEKLSDCQEYVRADGTRYHPAVIKIIDGLWGNEAGETLRQAHNQYKQCSGDIIIHFEADEVYDDRLIKNIVKCIHNEGVEDIGVFRLQLEQNFQRCRWYPEPVHRVFPRLSNTQKKGHTTDRMGLATILSPENGLLWDITNCFRDNWINRVNKQAELRNTEPQYLMTGLHSIFPVMIDKEVAELNLNNPHWTWKTTPFNIPKILKSLVGVTKYEPRL